MKALLMKDYRYLLQQKTSLLLFTLIAILLGCTSVKSTENVSFVIGYYAFLNTIFAVSTIGYDDVDHCHAFLLTLPCSKKGYICEKYLFVFFVNLIATVVSLCIIFVITEGKGISLDMNSVLIQAEAIFAVVLIVASFMIPIHYKYGITKSRWVTMIVFGILFVIVYVGKSLSNALHIDVYKMIKIVSKISLTEMAVGFCLLTVVCMAISIVICGKVIEHKEY